MNRLKLLVGAFPPGRHKELPNVVDSPLLQSASQTNNEMVPVPLYTHETFSNGVVQEYDVIIVGAGFSGISTLHRLRKEGFKTHIFESGSSAATISD